MRAFGMYNYVHYVHSVWFSHHYCYAFDSCRLMLGFGILPSVGLLVAMCFLVETPRWLVFHGKTEKACEVLKKLRHHKIVESELSNILAEHKKSQKDRLGTYV